MDFGLRLNTHINIQNAFQLSKILMSDLFLTTI